MHKIQKRAEPGHFSKWKAEYAAVHGRSPVYEDLANTREYGLLKKELVKEQGYICCYCQNRIGKSSKMDDCNIEHFKPRHPDRSLLTAEECEICENAQMDYRNMFASCLGRLQEDIDPCNHKKDNWYDFELCISPASDKINLLFGYHFNGKMIALNNNPYGNAMKDHLNLNTYILCEQRKAAFTAVLENEFDEDELLEDNTYILDTIADYGKMDRNGQYSPFCSMISYCLQEYFGNTLSAL